MNLQIYRWFQHLLTVVTKKPDLYLDELRMELEAKCGVSVTPNTIWRTLQRGGFTMKKVQAHPHRYLCVSDVLFQLTREAIERSAELRADFAARIGTYEADQLVFVDESAVDRRTTYRGKAWALRGKPATRKAFFCRGRR
jgi:hypothetical protein